MAVAGPEGVVGVDRGLPLMVLVLVVLGGRGWWSPAAATAVAVISAISTISAVRTSTGISSRIPSLGARLRLRSGPRLRLRAGPLHPVLLHLPLHLLVEGGAVRRPRRRGEGRGRVGVVIGAGLGRVRVVISGVGGVGGSSTRSRIGTGGIRGAVGGEGAGRGSLVCVGGAGPVRAGAAGAAGRTVPCRRSNSRSQRRRRCRSSAGGRSAAAAAAATTTHITVTFSTIATISATSASIIAATSISGAAPVAPVALRVGLVHRISEEGRLFHGITATTIAIAITTAISIGIVVAHLAVPLLEVVVDQIAARSAAAGVGDAVAVQQSAAAAALGARTRAGPRPGGGPLRLLLEPSPGTHYRG